MDLMIVLFAAIISVAALLTIHIRKTSSEDNSRTDSNEDTPDEKTDISTKYKLKSLLSGKKVIQKGDVEEILESIRIQLIDNGVALPVVDEILDNVEDDVLGEEENLGSGIEDVVKESLEESIEDILVEHSTGDLVKNIRESEKPYILLFVGVNGVGKTTTIAKLSNYLENRGLDTVLANGDTYRAGAQEQIQEHADKLETKLISHEQGSDSASVIYDAVEYADANSVDVVLGDTAGRLSNDEGLMNQIEKIDRVIEPDEVIFVDEAVAGQDVVGRAEDFDNVLSISGIILTKSDADDTSGAILSLPYTLHSPVYFLGNGQDYYDLAEFEAEEVASELID